MRIPSDDATLEVPEDDEAYELNGGRLLDVHEDEAEDEAAAMAAESREMASLLLVVKDIRRGDERERG